MSSLTLWAWLVLTAAPPLQPSSVSGTVVDPEGKPVKGATVWLTAFVRFDADVVELAQVETDAEGRFTIDAPVGGGDQPRSLTLWAHSPGATVAIASPSNRPKDDRGPIRLALGPPARTPVRVLGVDGKPVAGATVRLSPLDWPAGLRARLEATTDARGRATIEGVDPGQVHRVDVTAEGLGTQGQNVPQDEAEKTVQLLPVGRVAARIVSDDPKALAGWTVVASSHPEEASRPSHPTNAARGRSDEAGRVALGPLAAGRIAFRVEPPEGSPFLPLPDVPGQVALRGGESVEVKIPVRKGVKVEGSVREHGSAQAGGRGEGQPLRPLALSEERGRGHRRRGPLLAVFLALQAPREPDLVRPARPLFPRARQHPLGRLRHRRGRGEANARPAGGLAGVRDQGDGGRRGGQARRGGPGERLVHRPACSATGRSRAAPRRTSAGPSCSAGWRPTRPWRSGGDHRARAETQPVTVRLDREGVQDRPVALRLVKRPTVSLRGRVLGPGGRAGGRGAGVRSRSGRGMSRTPTVAARTRRSGPAPTARSGSPDEVPRSDQYRASVTAPGMEPAQSGWAKAPAGELPDVILRRPSRLRSVAGRVVDADGRAVAGAEVFQSGDGPRRTSDTTDADGRFTIPGVLDAPAFVFVKKAGYRFAGRRIGAGDEPVTVVVSKVEGPAPAPLKPAPAALVEGRGAGEGPRADRAGLEGLQAGRVRAAGAVPEGPDPGAGRYGPDGRDDRESGTEARRAAAGERRPGTLRGRSARRGRDARRAPPAGDGGRGAARPRRPGPRRPGRRPR